MQYTHLAFRVLTRNNQRNSACEILCGLFGNTLDMPVTVLMSGKELHAVLDNDGGLSKGNFLIILNLGTRWR